MKTMRSALVQLRLTGRWLSEPKHLIFAIVIVGFAVSLIYAFDATEQSVRLVGLGLQLIGIGTVIWEILVIRESFGHPALRRIVLGWFRRFPLIRRTACLEPEGIQVSASVVSGRLATVFQPKHDLPTEKQLEHLEQGLLIIQQRIEQTESQMDREFSSLHGEVVANVRELKRTDGEILKKVETVSTGDLHIAAIGALWLFIGVILSAAAPEISGLMR